MAAALAGLSKLPRYHRAASSSPQDATHLLLSVGSRLPVGFCCNARQLCCLRNNRKAFSLLFGHACAVHNRYNVMSGYVVAVAEVEREPAQAPPSIYFRRNSACCATKQSRSHHRSICVWFLFGASLRKSLTLGIHSAEAWCC